MFHLLTKFHSSSDLPAPDVEAAPSAESHHHWPGTALITAIGHIHIGHIGLPEPKRTYPLHEASYLEDELMSRLMEHL
jgi:hypothetical protein